VKLIIARHGATQTTPEGFIKGHLPIRLSDEGRNQATKLAQRLKDEPIDYIYASDLIRAAETMHEIARYHPDTPVEFSRDLRERDFGELTGTTKQDAGVAPSTSSVHIDTEHGESLRDVHDRINAFLGELQMKHADDTILLVVHKTVHKALHAIIEDAHHDAIKDKEGLSHTALHVVEQTDDGWHEHTYDDTSHL
jgi:broad specificity phosphatase PhoE